MKFKVFPKPAGRCFTHHTSHPPSSVENANSYIRAARAARAHGAQIGGGGDGGPPFIARASSVYARVLACYTNTITSHAHVAAAAVGFSRFCRGCLLCVQNVHIYCMHAAIHRDAHADAWNSTCIQYSHPASSSAPRFANARSRACRHSRLGA